MSDKNNLNKSKSFPLPTSAPSKTHKPMFSIDEASPVVDMAPVKQSAPIEVNPRRKDKRGVRTFGYLRTRFDRDVNKTTD